MKLRLLAAVTVAILGLAAPARAQTPAQAPAETISIVEPFGPGSPSEIAIRVLRPAIERELKVRLLVEHIGSANGDAALARLMAAQANGRTLLAITDASRIFHEYQSNAPRRLDQLKPIAKLTEGISLALAMPAGSPIDTWARFAEAAKARPPSVAGFGPSGPSAIFLTLIERHLGMKFQSQRYDLDLEVLAAMARDNEAGALATSSALAQHALGRPAPIVLLTSGARRHPMLPDTPTLAEITGQPREAFTISVGLFGPPGLSNDRAEALGRAFATAGKDAAVRAQALRLSLPLAVKDAQVLKETMARTRRVAQELSRK
jgi:tripartite-type tricarboxylate transporter receptor subunit TctC